MDAIRSWSTVTDYSSARFAQLYLAGFFIVASVSQLFAFEDYPDLITSYGFPLLNGGASTLAAVLIVGLEIAAVPSLLGMKLSRRSLRASFVMSWLALVYWLVIGVWQSITAETIANAGLFGSKVLLPQGWWLVSLVIALIVLYGFATWSSLRKK